MILGVLSPKAIPQMQDTAAVLGQLDLSQTKANYWHYYNTRGAQMASSMLKFNT
jgi:hydroxymethylglutaryl-CoA lyase